MTALYKNEGGSYMLHIDTGGGKEIKKKKERKKKEGKKERKTERKKRERVKKKDRMKERKRKRERTRNNWIVYTRLIYSSLRGRRTIHARQQLLHITSRLLPYSQWMRKDRCYITNNVGVDLHVACGMCTQQTRGSHYCAAVTPLELCHAY